MHTAYAQDCNSQPSGGLSDAPNVFIVDDDISVRESVDSLLRCAGWRTQTFASAEEFLASPSHTTPGCLILDYKLPNIDGLDLQKRIVADDRCLPIIFITCYGDPSMAVKAMKAGAMEVLIKPFGDEALLGAVQQAIARSRSVQQRHLERQRLRLRYATLSPREREVMSLVATGLLNKQIGCQLKVSEITVKAHRGRVMRKMKAQSLASLITMAIKLDLECSSSED